MVTPREPNSAITWARACENCYNLLQPKLIPGGRKRGTYVAADEGKVVDNTCHNNEREERVCNDYMEL